jgi:hypothetical protein
MKLKSRYNKLPWYEEVLCQVGAILLLPITIPLAVAFVFFGIAMIVFDKINDGFGH